MASVNKVILLGNLGKDPELRHTPSGSAVCVISIATSRSWKNKDSGEKVEETEWHRVVFYDRLAEIVGEYAAKGKPLYVEGRLKTRKWTDKENIERYATEIVAESLQLLGGRDDAGGGQRSAEPQQSQSRSAPQQTRQGAAQESSRQPARAATTQRPAPRSEERAPFDDMDSDIPF